MELITQLFAQFDWRVVTAAGLRLVLIVAAAWVVMRLARAALGRLEQRLIRRGEETGEVPSETAKRAETLVKLLRQAVYVVLWIVVGLVILRELGVEIAPILASAGILGLAVGFGAQNLVRDVISGFFFILENQIRVGDVAVINGTGGLVEQINFRTIRLRDLAGTVHVFPNGTITTLSNLTQEWSAYVFEIGIAYKEDTDRAVEVMQQVGSGLRADEYFGPSILEDVEVFGVDKLADSAVIIKGRIKTRPIKQWEVGRQFLRRVKKAFDVEGIEIPFPHRSIYFGAASQPIDVLLKQPSTGAERPAE
ncbi:MAG: mechanosensitive ion channel family protein [Gammaproteobacteria bacterium]|nr:mechanosensitive ion channel family protein [Gammaproteobacteria bacterium]NIR85893.1 mechanosensitive ion channel family protein [Gammaproteobacteria bacterium]NIR92084.1 mechanosensitive ion channel family protein [Gammaproteobacteria bacterium]NIV51420.1 mechanosensitive ion channel [Gammaproteobacteria bacterium]NIV77105.1 mechanosensitive ion channel [Gammaproteobacteria bacterium]